MRDMVLADWRGLLGSGRLDYSGTGTRRVQVDLVSTGCALYVLSGDQQHLVAYGDGAMTVCFVVEGDFSILLASFEEDGRTSIRIPSDRLVEAGWAEGLPYVQLDLKSANDVTPEVRRMMDTMQRNSLLREQILRNELSQMREVLQKKV